MAALLFALGGWLYLEQVNPRYHGRRTSEWLLALKSENKEQAKDAELAIFMLGESAVPQIEEFFYATESQRMMDIFAWIEAKTNWEMKRPDIYGLHQVGERGVEILGHRAASMLPRLIESLADDVFSDMAISAIEKIGKPADVPLKAALKHYKERIRIQATLILVERKQSDIMPQLKGFLRSGSYEHRALAIQSMAALGCPKEEFLPLLRPLLEERDSRLRESAVNALGVLAETDSEVLPEFLKLLMDADIVTRSIVIRRLHRFDTANKAVTDALIACLKDPDEFIRISALREIHMQFTGAERSRFTPDFLSMHYTEEYFWSSKFTPVRKVEFSIAPLFFRADEFIASIRLFAGQSPEYDGLAKVGLLFLDPNLRPLAEETLVLLDEAGRQESVNLQMYNKIKTEIDANLVKLSSLQTNLTIAQLRAWVRGLEQTDRILPPR